MDSNPCLPPGHAAARVRRRAALSTMAWSGTALAVWVGLSSAVAALWEIAAIAFCAGAGIAFAYRRHTVRALVAESKLTPPPPTYMPFIGLGVWQAIDRDRDLLHLLQQRAHSPTHGSDAAQSASKIEGMPGRPMT